MTMKDSGLTVPCNPSNLRACPMLPSFGRPRGRIPDTSGAFFLLLGGSGSQACELPLACSLSSHHSVPRDSGSGRGPEVIPPPL